MRKIVKQKKVQRRNVFYCKNPINNRRKMLFFTHTPQLQCIHYDTFLLYALFFLNVLLKKYLLFVWLGSFSEILPNFNYCTFQIVDRSIVYSCLHSCQVTLFLNNNLRFIYRRCLRLNKAWIIILKYC